MAIADQVAGFKQANPSIQLLTAEASEWSEWRETRGQAGQERKPLGIAIPKDAQEVAAIVRWAKASSVDFTVRTGGNDFYGRNVANGALIIDMREIKSVEVAADKKTVKIGGGIITKDLVHKLDAEGLCVPCGNTWIVGYVGWVTFGGYGPMTAPFGMGYEGILGAQLVNAEGEVVEANEEQLEGLRGLGGNMGIVTSMTIKTYPTLKVLSGMVMFDATPENVAKILAAEAKLTFPKCLTFHHFIMKLQDRKLAIMYTWGDKDHEKGKQFLEEFIAEMPPVFMNTVAPKTLMKHYEEVPLHCLPWGGQRCLYVKEMTTTLLEPLMEALAIMPNEVNMGWSMTIDGDPSTAPPNFFGAGHHILLSFSDMVPEEKLLKPARAWNDALYEKLRASNDPAILEASYPPLTRPDDRTSEQLLGKKFTRAKELKKKYDPNNVFKYAIPPL